MRLILKKRKIRFPPAPLSSACVFFYIYLCICVYIYIGFFRFYKSEHNRIKPKKTEWVILLSIEKAYSDENGIGDFFIMELVR